MYEPLDRLKYFIPASVARYRLPFLSSANPLIIFFAEGVFVSEASNEENIERFLSYLEIPSLEVPIHKIPALSSSTEKIPSLGIRLSPSVLSFTGINCFFPASNSCKVVLEPIQNLLPLVLVKLY